MGPRLVVIKLVNITLRVINFVHMDNIVRNMIVISNFAKKEETLIMLKWVRGNYMNGQSLASYLG